MPNFKNTGLTERGRQEELLKVAEQAAAWLIEVEEGGAQERAALAAWLEESPLHVEMFLRANSVDRMTDLMAPEDVKALAGKDWGDDSAVAALPLTSDRYTSAPSLSHRRGRTNKRRYFGIAAAVAALVAGAAWYEMLGPGSWDGYETQIGEQRVVSLADGSMIYVNTDSRIDVRYTAAAREIRLQEGEALFKVERDARRPFRVNVGDTVVQAVGTQFNVYRRSSEIKVAVVEGIVQVSKSTGEVATATTAPVAKDVRRLTAGQGLSLGKDGTPEKPVAVNVAQATAWRQRRLVFEWQTLDEIAAEFNRYNKSPQIRVEGDEVRQRRYTAVFDADNPQTLLKFLSEDDRLKFAAEGDDFVIRSR